MSESSKLPPQNPPRDDDGPQDGAESSRHRHDDTRIVGERLFVVLMLNKTVTVSISGIDNELPLSYAPGMVGAMPVFDDLESAQQFAGTQYRIAEVAAVDAKIEAREREKAK